MVTEDDRRTAFEKFMEGVNRLLADENFREVLLELDAGGEEAVGLLGPDPAAFLKHRGVPIPEDFRVSIRVAQRQVNEAETETECYCLMICWWRWCIEICRCRQVPVTFVE